MLDVALLGTGGMMPLPDRFLTSLMCRLNGRFLMIDCGEGTQVTMKMLGWGFKNIDCICITHFHADHISGMPGLLLTIGNSGREEPLTIVGPIGLEHVVKSLCVIAPELPFEIKFIEMDDSSENIHVGDFLIDSLKLEHRIPCFGYRLRVPRQGKFNLQKAKNLDLPVQYWSKLQNHEDVIYEGKTYTPDMVLGDDRKGLQVSYMTDTRPTDDMIDFVEGSDLFIGEGIYGDNEKVDKAKGYMHMTFPEAATIAKKANAKKLWLTHYSPALTNPEEFLHVATDIFPNAELGFDRKNINISFED